MVVEEGWYFWLLAWLQIRKLYFMDSCRFSSLNCWGYISETHTLVLFLCVWLLFQCHLGLCCQGLVLPISPPRTEWRQPHGKLKEIENPVRTQRQAHSQECSCVQKFVTGHANGWDGRLPTGLPLCHGALMEESSTKAERSGRCTSHIRFEHPSKMLCTWACSTFQCQNCVTQELSPYKCHRNRSGYFKGRQSCYSQTSF